MGAGGFIAFLLGLLWLAWAALRDFPRWIYADRYVAGEVEVVRFTTGRHEHRAATITGIVHPGGEQVQARTSDIAISQFIDPDARAVRFRPLPARSKGSACPRASA